MHPIPTMTTDRKAEFVRELMESVGQSLAEDLTRVPADWDGHELRQWIADRFAREVCGDVMKGRRLRDYRNAAAMSNL